ncbi:MAG: flagellar biosynthetic protein FliO [Thermoguttaceae bacterium]|jgi:flagellar biogenesis protein FliO
MPTIASLLGLIVAVAGPLPLSEPPREAALPSSSPAVAASAAPPAADAAAGSRPMAISPPAVALPPAGAAAASPAPTRREPLLLGNRNPRGAHDSPSGGLSAVVTVGSSLALVLGLFFLVAWAMRKAAPRGSLLLPHEVFEILGRAPLGARQQVQLLRCGNKLLLVSTTPAGAETLTEVTEPLEVDRLAGLCRQAHPHSASAAFRQIFQQLAPRSGSPRLDERELEPQSAPRSGSPRLDAPQVEPLRNTRRESRRWENDDA